MEQTPKGQRNFMGQHRHKKKAKEWALSREVDEMRVTIAELTASMGDKSKRKRASDSGSDNSDDSDNVKKTKVKSTKRG